MKRMDYSKNVLGCASCNCDGHIDLPSEERQKRDKKTTFLVRRLDLTFG